MEALRLTAKASEGKLTVAVPDSFNEQEVEVIVLMQPKDAAQQSAELDELHRRRMELFGKAKYPDFPITKYDVYNQ